MVGVYSPPETPALSGVIIDTDLAMGGHNVTLNAGQTVDGKIVHDLPVFLLPAAGDDLQDSVDAELEVTATGESPPTTVFKTLTIPKSYKSGTFRIKFDVKSGGSALNTRTQLRKNGAVLGNNDIKPFGETAYETITQDLGSIVGGDIITLCASDDTGAAGYIRNFRIYCSVKVTGDW